MSSSGTMNEFDLMDDSPRDSMEWLKSDMDAHLVTNVDMLLFDDVGSGNSGIVGAAPGTNTSPLNPTQREVKREGAASSTGKAASTNQTGGKRKAPAASKKASSNNRKVARRGSSNNATAKPKATPRADGDKPTAKKIKRLEAHNAAEKRRQQRIAEEIDHIRSVLVKQGATVGSTKRELFQATVRHMEAMWNRISVYEQEAAKRASHDDLRIAKLLKGSCTQAMYELNTDLHVTHAFGACSDITGHADPSVLVGKDFLDLVHPDDKPRVQSYFTAVFARDTFQDVPIPGSAQTFSSRMPAILFPLQFRRAHATHSFYVPVQINCHAMTNENDEGLFGDDVDPSQCVRLMFSERSTMVNRPDTIAPLERKKDTKKSSANPGNEESSIKKRNLKMKLLRRSHTWHNSTLYEMNAMTQKLPKIQR